MLGDAGDAGGCQRMSASGPDCNRSTLSVLTEDRVERIHEGALQVLARTGIAIHDDGVLALLGGAGCGVGHGGENHRR
ncbi:MAG: hypothetical protein GQ526_07295, partial [Ardenticatenales bacterium]|nr:hypothetical protein [Ardenticatenales bacterium]